MDKIVALIRDGETYRAVEQVRPIIRKLKRQGKVNDAMEMMMKLAIELLDIGEYHNASVCALRSIEMFPSDATTIKVFLKKLFFSFLKTATPQCVCSEFYQFCQSLMYLFSKKQEKILRIQGKLADEAGDFLNAQKSYVQVISIADDVDSCRDIVSDLMVMLWKWIVFEKSDVDKTVEVSQFIIARCVLILASIEKNGLLVASFVLDNIFKQAPDELKDRKPEELPLIHFCRLYFKALLSKSKEAIDYLLKMYAPILEVDQDILNFAKKSMRSNGFKKPKGLFDFLS